MSGGVFYFEPPSRKTCIDVFAFILYLAHIIVVFHIHLYAFSKYSKIEKDD